MVIFQAIREAQSPFFDTANQSQQLITEDQGKTLRSHKKRKEKRSMQISQLVPLIPVLVFLFPTMGPPAPFNTTTIGKTSLCSTRINYAKRLRSSTSLTTSPSTHATILYYIT
ncbi:hypothetical protein L873DRAFT_707557 [Choiromyces venosus 120613-1]|uniref:Uncharacterized protein n=1 Tax=Choiromyces venosus 120613-1 TaxID=1336337 RepID=A0A3N4IW34_9PEZI|nr:hypothetical protein L873DRAFT_707557 [Choiromyces venosus 120613-1]